MAKVDATSSSGLGSRFDVSGYPTIKIIKKGEPVDYDGARTEKGRALIFAFQMARFTGVCIDDALTCRSHR